MALFQYSVLTTYLSGMNDKYGMEEEADWMEYYYRKKAQAVELKFQIAQTDSEIDAMVYELYKLSGEEVRVVEGAN